MRNKIFTRWYFWVAIAVVIIAAVAIILIVSKPHAKPAEAVSFEEQFSCGNYTSGIDYPAGNYDIIPISGSGNVSASSGAGTINAMLGAEDASGGSSLFKQKYSDMALSDGTVLSISSGLKIKIASSSAQKNE